MRYYDCTFVSNINKYPEDFWQDGFPASYDIISVDYFANENNIRLDKEYKNFNKRGLLIDNELSEYCVKNMLYMSNKKATILASHKPSISERVEFITNSGLFVAYPIHIACLSHTYMEKKCIRHSKNLRQ